MLHLFDISKISKVDLKLTNVGQIYKKKIIVKMIQYKNYTYIYIYIYTYIYMRIYIYICVFTCLFYFYVRLFYLTC